MDFSYSEEEKQFRATVREFVQTHVPKETAHRVSHGLRMKKADIVNWQKILFEKGWGSVSWPKAFGGCEWTPTQQYIFEEECAEANAPIQLPFGLKMVAPVLMAYGNPAQQAKFLPRILQGDDWWCQGYSEPGSGSDLASLKTKAERQGDHYVVNGQKNMDHPCPARRLDFLPRTNKRRRPSTRRDFLFVNRYENSRNYSSSNYHD